MFVAGNWREWVGTRETKADPATGKHLLFSFLTTDASENVAPIPSDAMPVLLLEDGEHEMWKSAPWDVAQSLQRPSPQSALRVVAKDTKQDAGL
jgi:putative SOS response-associated peptidase YedK